MSNFITIRPYKEDDKAFIFATYLRNTWYSKDNTTTLEKGLWMGLQHARMEKALPTLGIRVACITDDPDTILGYSFKDQDKQFTYIKLAFRDPSYNITNLLESEK